MNHNKASLDIIKKLIVFLDGLTDDDLEKISANKASVRFELIDSEKRTKIRRLKKIDRVITSSKVISKVNIDALLHDLNNLDNREKGYEYLKNTISNRLDMEAILKKLDVPFTKRDNLEMLISKVVEGTIGFRLTSNAIRANNFQQ